MSQRFTVTGAFSKSDGERCTSDMQGEVNQLFEGDEPEPSSSHNDGATGLTEDAAKGRMRCASLPVVPTHTLKVPACTPARLAQLSLAWPAWLSVSLFV